MASRGVNTPCWEWQGHIHNSGYGRLTNKLKTQYAHRFVWEAFYNPIPAGLDVCHHCDNKICVNPNHLFLGTRKDNMTDARVKNRLQRGEDRYNSVLNESTVIEARRLSSIGCKTKDIAKKFNIKPQPMGKAINHKTWRHIA